MPAASITLRMDRICILLRRTISLDRDARRGCLPFSCLRFGSDARSHLRPAPLLLGSGTRVMGGGVALSGKSAAAPPVDDCAQYRDSSQGDQPSRNASSKAPRVAPPSAAIASGAAAQHPIAKTVAPTA